MKTTIKLGLYAAAFLLMFAGCSNAVKPSAVADDSFRAHAIDEQQINSSSVEAEKILTVKNVSKPAKYGNADKYRIDVTFSMNVTEESAKKAITFNVLTPSKNALEVAKVGASLSADITVDGNVAHCDVSGKDVYLWMKITGSDVTAVNGQHLNEDKDAIAGEVDDDDFVMYTSFNEHTSVPLASSVVSFPNDFKLGTPTDAIGITNFLNVGSKNKVYVNDFLKPQFYKASESLNSGETAPEGSGDLITKVEILLTVEDHGVAADDVTKIIKDHLRIEQYVNGEWTEIKADFGSYDATNRKWRAPLTVEPDTWVRYKWINVRNMPALKSTKYQYQINQIKADKNCNPANTVVADTLVSTNHAKNKFALWENSTSTGILSTNYDTLDLTNDDHLTITLNGDKLTQNLWFSNTLSNASVTPKKDKNPPGTGTYYVDFTGFAANAELTKPENFKLVLSGGKKYSAKAEYSNEDGVQLQSKVTLNMVHNVSVTEAEITKVLTSCSNVSLYPKTVNNKLSVYYRIPKQFTNAEIKEIFKAQLVAWVKSPNFYDEVFSKLPYMNAAEKSKKAKKFVDAVIKKAQTEPITLSSGGSEISKAGFYMSSKIKAAKFTGTYEDGTTYKDVNVPELGFKIAEPKTDENDIYQLKGWLKLN